MKQLHLGLKLALTNWHSGPGLKGGMGLGKPLKLIIKPLVPRSPINIGALGPKKHRADRRAG